MTNLNSKNRDIHIALPLIGLGKPILPSRGAGHPIKPVAGLAARLWR